MHAYAYISSLAICCLFTASVCAQSKQPKEMAGTRVDVPASRKPADSAKLAARQSSTQLALSDYRAGHLKYYSFGIVPASPALVAQLKAYKITVVSLGCMADQGIQSYNATVDSILSAVYHTSMAAISRKAQ